MIWHFFEVWGLLLVAFAAGCLLGTLLYVALAATPLAGAQVAAADAISDAVGGIRLRLGGSRETGAYRKQAKVESLPPSAPLAPDLYPVTEAAQWPGESASGEAIKEAFDPTDSEWDDDAYWDAEGEQPPALQRTAAAPATLPERSPAIVQSAAPSSSEPELTPELPAMRPLTLPGPRNGVPDNLQRIRGIGQKNEELLNSLGIYHFGQIAAWTPAEARWVANHLAFPERIERDDWIGQAIILATGGDTGYVKAADRRRGGEEPPVAA